MGTNYFWYLDQELLRNPDLYVFNDNIPSIVKEVYRQALREEDRANSERSGYLREDDSVVKGFSYETGPIKVKALHIGKRSWGWRFGLHVYPDLINSYHDWLEILPYGTIKNEYGEAIRKSQMVEIIDVDGLIGINADELIKENRRGHVVKDPYTIYDNEYELFRRVTGNDYCCGSYKAVDYCIGYFS